MFTQGKWEVHYNKQRGVWEVWPEKDGLGRVCSITNRDNADEQSIACLIAAAPDLLESLSKAAPFVCKCIDENNNAGTLYNKIQDLLELQAKAESE